MFKITYFDKKLCYLSGHHLDLVEEDDCDFYTIWQFCPTTRWRLINKFFNSNALCKAAYFPLIYWLVFIISVMGSLHSLNEFSSLFWGTSKRLSMWRPRKFYVLPSTVVRKCRLVGSLIMLFNWLLLWYAVVKVSPIHMTPWLTINMFVLGFELITWFFEVLMGVCKLELNTLLSFSLFMANYGFVYCVQCVFEKAIALNDVENLRLWKNV